MTLDKPVETDQPAAEEPWYRTLGPRLRAAGLLGTPEVGPKVRFQSLAEVPTESLQWVWEGLIPRGKVTLVTGEAAVGKSLFTLQVAAMVSRGVTNPVSGDPSLNDRSPSGSEKSEQDTSSAETSASPGLTDIQQRWRKSSFRSFRDKRIASTTPAQARASSHDPVKTVPPVENRSRSTTPPGAVLLLSADDGVADTIKPRLEAAGADISRIFVLQLDREPAKKPKKQPWEKPDPPPPWFPCQEKYLEALHQQVKTLKEAGTPVSLIVIDPIEAYLSSGSQAEQREMMDRLVDLAAQSQAAVLVVSNSAAAKKNARSLTFHNAARAVLMIAQDLETAGTRLVIPVKLNLAENRPSLSFTIRGNAVTWNSASIAVTSDEYLEQAKERQKNPLVREEQSELDRVTNWLKTRLSHGKVSSKDVRAEAEEQEMAYATLRRAFHRLGCKAEKSAGNGAWFWRLPGLPILDQPNWRKRDDQAAQRAQDAQV